MFAKTFENTRHGQILAVKRENDDRPAVVLTAVFDGMAADLSFGFRDTATGRRQRDDFYSSLDANRASVLFDGLRGD